MKKFSNRVGTSLHLTKYMAAGFFLIVCVALSSCFIGEKTKNNKIVGTWKMVNTWNMNADPADNEYWQFADGAFSRHKGFPPVKIDSVIYFITQKVSKGYVTIDYGGSSSGAVPNGTWEILKLNKNQLIIEKTQGGKVLREFLKDDDL